MYKFNGIELYNGPSMLDGSPIIAVLILKSMNSKTGDMMQLHIIRADMAPLMASKKKLDHAICGNCSHKHSDGGACYVNIGQGPTVVYKTWKAGKYPAYTSEHDTRISALWRSCRNTLRNTQTSNRHRPRVHRIHSSNRPSKF